MFEKKISRSLGTHDGTFHADEVTASALLLLFDLIDEDKIVRTRDPKRHATCEFVCDVGGIYDPAQKKFDHHQADYQGSLSSAGMILLYLKDSGIMEPAVYSYFNERLILGVDAHDNGRSPQILGLCSYSHVIANFVPILYDPPPHEEDEAFIKALHFAKSHLARLLERYHYTQSCRQTVADEMAKQNQCLVFEKGIPWIELFFELGGKEHPAQFVIMPSGIHWNLRGIPPTYEDRMNVRIPLPENWAGLLEGELQKVANIPGAIFCHKGRFVSVWETKEDAKTALEYVMNHVEERA